MTRDEATAVIGERVVDTDSGETGTLTAIRTRKCRNGDGSYYVGCVESDERRRWVWLKLLEPVLVPQREH
jgi:hypothetical protein